MVLRFSKNGRTFQFLVTFLSGHFRSRGRRIKILKNRNVRRTLIAIDPCALQIRYLHGSAAILQEDLHGFVGLSEAIEDARDAQLAHRGVNGRLRTYTDTANRISYAPL